METQTIKQENFKLIYETLTGIRRACKDAIGVQDACNISGVVFAFATHMRVLCDAEHAVDGASPEYAARFGFKLGRRKADYPAIVLFAYKVNALAGMENLAEYATDKYYAAEAECERIVAAVDAELESLYRS